MHALSFDIAGNLGAGGVGAGLGVDDGPLVETQFLPFPGHGKAH